MLTALSALPFLVIQNNASVSTTASHQVALAEAQKTSPKPKPDSPVVAPKPTPPAPATVVSDEQTPPPAAAPAAVATPVTPPDPGDHDALMADAGIPASDYSYVNYIVRVESSWNPYAVESASGACGLMQELPCGKSGCSLGDEVCELEWGASYVTSRYGGWYQAYTFHVANGWY